MFDIKDDKKSEKKVVDGASNFGISPNHKKLVVLRGDDFYLVDAAAGQKLDKKFQTRGMKTSINPRDEWKQIFGDVWRMEKEFFYDPNMHGLDWDAVRAKFEPLLPHLGRREDLNELLIEMTGEMGVGHNYIGGGDIYSSNTTSPGLLGADIARENGLYRIKAAEGDPIYRRSVEEQDWSIIPSAEARDVFLARVRRGLSEIAHAHANERVAVFVHGGVIAAALHLATNSEPFAFLGAANGSISRLVILKDRWVVRGFNDINHLKHL